MIWLNKNLSYLLNDVIQDEIVLLTEKSGSLSLERNQEVCSQCLVTPLKILEFFKNREKHQIDTYVGKIQLRWGTIEQLIQCH